MSTLVAAGAAPCDHDRDFAALEVVFGRAPLGELGEGAAVDGLVGFGELAGDDGATVVAELGGEVGEGRGDAVGRLEEDQRARLVGELREVRPALALARRQEAFEAEAADGQSCDGQRRGDGGRAGDGLDIDAGLGGSAHQLIARDRRAAACRHR